MLLKFVSFANEHEKHFELIATSCKTERLQFFFYNLKIVALVASFKNPVCLDVVKKL